MTFRRFPPFVCAFVRATAASFPVAVFCKLPVFVVAAWIQCFSHRTDEDIPFGNVYGTTFNMLCYRLSFFFGAGNADVIISAGNMRQEAFPY
ncbi:hypothetical protein SDC9_193982 [bioreactor metagenome]|uniref:Uncharacterized protein n=1 Tax=bioreactor metagenome TaxID=1076179 RepID=A0A645I676_9ZZZZ